MRSIDDIPKFGRLNCSIIWIDQNSANITGSFGMNEGFVLLLHREIVDIAIDSYNASATRSTKRKEKKKGCCQLLPLDQLIEFLSVRESL